jgi:penicillin-binding protein 2
MIWRHAIVMVVVLLAGCGVAEQIPTATPTAPTVTPVPKRPEDAANGFFAAWQQGQFSTMYELLSADARAATPRDVFVRRYTNIHSGIGELKLTAQASGPPSDTGQVPFQVTRGLAIFGDITEDNTLQLVQDQDGAWKVAWHPGLIFTGLTATSTVRLTPDVPARGRIVDRNDKPLADNGSILAVGVVPGEIKDEAALLETLSDALGIAPETVKQRYQGGEPTWFMPILERPASDRAELEPAIGSIPGVALQDRPARVYPLGAAAAHVVGYIAHPTSDELRQLASAGYDESDWVGRSGIEAWAEDQLAGKKGGTIQIVDESGRLVRTIAQKRAVSGADVHLALDGAIQQGAFGALGDKMGSVVVMGTGGGLNDVLALVSNPTFDPNRFVTGLSDAEWQVLNGPDRPLLLRATESAYPTGSIFKVITMAAGMEHGVARASDTYDCGLDWNGLPGITLHNWQAEGMLSLSEALTESCNPAFFEIGLKLDRLDPSLLPTYARQFGLGKPTGVLAVHEVAGAVPDPTWKQQQVGEPWTSGDSVNLAIGQGYLLATPLQMANAFAALGRAGTLLAPHVLADQKAQPLGSLNLSQSTLSAILDGMKRVTSTSRGTAYYAFRDEKLAIAAKTGSAENENPDAHAWFVGLIPPDNPRLIVLVMLEGGQHGGTVAAPVARTLIDMAYPLTR